MNQNYSYTTNKIFGVKIKNPSIEFLPDKKIEQEKKEINILSSKFKVNFYKIIKVYWANKSNYFINVFIPEGLDEYIVNAYEVNEEQSKLAFEHSKKLEYLFFKFNFYLEDIFEESGFHECLFVYAIVDQEGNTYISKESYEYYKKCLDYEKDIKIISIKNKKLKIKSNLKDSISYLLGKAHLVV